MTTMTADLCDEFADDVRVADAVFRAYGARQRFFGPVCTLRVFEDNSLVRECVQSDGHGRVLVVDGGGSRQRALLGGNLATRAVDNGWAGIVINGAIRDRVEIDPLPIGVLALQTQPRKSRKEGRGEKDVDISFAGVAFRPGDFVYVDEDGLLVASRALHDTA